MRISRMNGRRATVGGLVLAAAAAVTVPAAAAQAGTGAAGHAARPLGTNGCSNGTVCMYTPSGWNHGKTEHHWWVYGCYNLRNEHGQRYVFNKQYGGATAKLWTGTNCHGKATTIRAGKVWSGNITPINSISLNK